MSHVSRLAKGKDGRIIYAARGLGAHRRGISPLSLCLAPEFVVRGLEAGMDVTLKVRATNHRGQSVSISLETDIMKVAEKRMALTSSRLTPSNISPARPHTPSDRANYLRIALCPAPKPPMTMEARPPAKGVLLPPVVGAVVGGVGAVLVLVVVGLVLTHYTRRSRPHTHSKGDSPPTLTNVYVGGPSDVCSEDAHETHAHSKAANPDVVRGTGHNRSSRGKRPRPLLFHLPTSTANQCIYHGGDTWVGHSCVLAQLCALWQAELRGILMPHRRV
ncbi:hypothetical protein GWK47_037562 [Chionoecetes opilio]|uniref:Uncharacterized protein n=1 Tax=Chionoecetes opilio TaxID=41210 RepID=A0A8J4YLN4_CHIOP|nr:hypothetical protein GWK47_037562 [Chionoecetes opilio]